MVSLLEKIKKDKLVLSDGAWGTSFQKLGLKTGQCPEKWNLDHPGKVKEVARSFLDVGSGIIKTNSFGGNRFKLKYYGLEGKVGEINEKAASLSREAAGDKAYVFASIGPTGMIIMTGEVTAEELLDAFTEQAKALEKGGADVILVETMADLEEASLAIKAAKENTGCLVAATMTFSKTVDGEYRTMMGVSPSDMVTALRGAGADLIGTNCGNGMKNMIDIVKEIRQVDQDIPVVVHANAGMPRYEDGETVFPETPEETASHVKDLVSAGANIIGGCCGTTPEHLEKIKDVREQIEK